MFYNRTVLIVTRSIPGFGSPSARTIMSYQDPLIRIDYSLSAERKNIDIVSNTAY